MGTYYRRPNSIVTVGTTRLITITTGASQVIYISSGYNAMNAMNNGPAPISFGDSSLLMGSGNVIFPYAQYIFENLSGDFSIYMRADSAQSVIALTEFKQ